MSPNTQKPPQSGCLPSGSGGTELRADSLGGHDAPFQHDTLKSQSKHDEHCSRCRSTRSLPKPKFRQALHMSGRKRLGLKDC